MRAPWPLSLWHGANHGWWPLLWFTGKVILFIFVFVWLRGTLPRLRYDQFMHLGWKILIPANLIWLMAIAAVRVLEARGWATWQVGLIIAGGLLAVLLLALLGHDASLTGRRLQEIEDDEEEAAKGPTFPIPPMDLKIPQSRPAQKLATASRGASALGDRTDG